MAFHDREESKLGTSFSIVWNTLILFPVMIVLWNTLEREHFWWVSSIAFVISVVTGGWILNQWLMRRRRKLYR